MRASLVVPDERPAVRGQAWQMAQEIHFLWPPFLLGGFYRLERRLPRARFEAFVHNLYFLRG